MLSPAAPAREVYQCIGGLARIPLPMPTPYIASPLGRLGSRLLYRRAIWRTCARTLRCSCNGAVEAMRANLLPRAVKPSGCGPTLAEASTPITLCADVGAAASPVRPAA